MEIQPLGLRILVKPQKQEEKTKGGIYIPDTAKEKKHEGEVISVGTDAVPVKKGDTIMYESYAGTEITNDGEKYLIMDIKDVLAILK